MTSLATWAETLVMVGLAGISTCGAGGGVETGLFWSVGGGEVSGGNEIARVGLPEGPGGDGGLAELGEQVGVAAGAVLPLSFATKGLTMELGTDGAGAADETTLAWFFDGGDGLSKLQVLRVAARS